MVVTSKAFEAKQSMVLYLMSS